MKLAIITPVFPPYYAGIGQVAAQEAEGLAEKGHQITVFTPLYGEEEKIERLEDYRIKRLRTVFKFGNAAWLPGLTKELKGFDLVHLHYPFIGSVGAVLKSDVPLVVTYHMDLVGYGWKRLFFSLYSRLTLPKVIRVAKKIVVSSFNYASQSRLARYLAEEPWKFAEVPFGIDIGCHPRESGDPENVILSEAEKSLDSRFRGNDNDRIKFLNNNLGIKEKDNVVLFVGGLDKAHYFKGVDILLKAVKELIFNIPARTTGVARAGGQYSISKYYNIKILIIGEGELRSKYESLTKQLGLSNNVIFAGRVESEDLPFYYQAADVFVLPSLDRSEAYGLVLLEAMAQGVPVVASDLPGVRTLVGPDRGLLVRPKDAVDLARALAEILKDEEKRKTMGERARQWVLAERSREREMQKLEEIFRSVAGDKV